MTVTIGVDAHKRLHVAHALDGTGQQLGERRGPNRACGSGLGGVCRRFPCCQVRGRTTRRGGASLCKDVLARSATNAGDAVEA
jgi:hypothetical protein